MIELADFDYYLPSSLIAQIPPDRRDRSRILVLGRENGGIRHEHFHDILKYLKTGDVLVLNDSKVIAARLLGQKEMTGGKVEILLDTPVSDNKWLVLGRGLTSGARIRFNKSNLACAIEKKVGDRYQVLFNMSGDKFLREVDKIGNVPLPPYIRVRSSELGVRSLYKERYQTVYAKVRGSVAAPTAGLHFTDELLRKIKNNGVEIKKVTLHVGSGTFLPVKTQKIEDHKMHKEFYSVDAKTYDDIIRAKQEGRRIIAVGTTSARVLEALASNTLQNCELNESTKLRINNDAEGSDPKKLRSPDAASPSGIPIEVSGLTTNSWKLEANEARETVSGWTDIFIYPGYKFKIVDGLITNFHLPKSTLLMLVSAFAGRENVMKAYEEAIKKKYRFYSFGDAMLIL
jgi:S-adenosylmethionine:tRNA ribosyltransferase-isomerase